MKRLLSLSIAAALMCCPLAMGQSKPAPATPATPAPAQPAAGKPAPKGDKPAADKGPSDAAKAAWEKDAKPGPEQEKLKWFAGEWQAVTTEMGPEGTSTSDGTFSCKMTMGERYLSMDYDGRSRGKFFHGAGYMGYSNSSKQYEMFWIDSMTTSMSLMSGSVDKDGKVFTFVGTYTDPATGKKLATKEILTITGKDTYKNEFFMDMNGKETKMMEMAFTKGAKPAKKDDDKKADAPAPAKK